MGSYSNLVGLLVAAQGFRDLASAELDEVLDTFGEPGAKETVDNLLAFEAKVFSRPEEYLTNFNALADEDKVKVLGFAQYTIRKSMFQEISNFIELNAVQPA